MKTLLLSFVVFSMSLIATLGMAQSKPGSTAKMPMHDTMSMESSMNRQNMKDTGQLMKRISDTMEKHKMTDEQQIECAKIMNKLANTIMNCAADVELKDVDKHKNEIKEITKEWDYFQTQNYKYYGN